MWNRRSQEAAAPQSVTLFNCANVIQMFHKAALTRRHEIKMFVELANWEMTMADQGKAEEGGTIRRKKLCWKLFASSLSHGSATAWTISDRRADAVASPCQGKPGSHSPACPLMLSCCPVSRMRPRQPLMSSLNWDF